MVGSFRAQNFQTSRKFHELPRKLFHFKSITPIHPGGAVLGETWRDGWRMKVGIRELEGREEGGGKEERGRRED